MAQETWPLQPYEVRITNSEAKRMRSRHAAQNRRLYENSEFERLAVSLPIPRDISSQLLDKASIVRLTISCLKFCDFSQNGVSNWMHPQHGCLELQPASFCQESDSTERSLAFDIESKMGSKILEALDGFLLCLTANGTILYVSETISVGLGLSQIEMIGNPLTDYIHKGDSNRFISVMSSMQSGCLSEQEMCLRLRSTLSKRVSKDSMQSSVGHKVVQLFLSARLSNDNSSLGMCCLGYPLPSTATADRRLDLSSFVITTQLDLVIHYIDPRGEEILGYCSGTSAPRGMSLYQLIHADDLAQLSHLHKEVLKLGGSSTSYFRLLCCGGGILWIHAFGIRIQKQKSRQQINFLTICCTVLHDKDFSELSDIGQISHGSSQSLEVQTSGSQWSEHTKYFPYANESVFYSS